MLRKGVVLLVAVSGAFVIAELAAQVWLRGFASEEPFRRYASLGQQLARSTALGQSPFKYLPHNYLGYAPAAGYVRGKNRHNDRGFRGDPVLTPKPRGEFRIVCIGGSTTYTSFVEDHALSYPSLLETGLRERGHESVRVINAGAEGYTSWESLVNLQFRVLDLEPDVVIIYHAVNDVLSRLVWPPWAYRGDNSGNLQDSGNFYRSPPGLQWSTLLRILQIHFGEPSPSALPSTHVQFAPTSYGGRWSSRRSSDLTRRGSSRRWALTKCSARTRRFISSATFVTWWRSHSNRKFNRCS